jgi:multiple sugar transport system permease protein
MARIEAVTPSEARAPRPSRLEASRRRFAYSMLTPIMLYMMVFALLPMVWALALGFFDYSPARASDGPLGLGGANPFVGVENYRAMFGDSQPARVFRQSVANTFTFALLVLPLNLLITLPLAVLIEGVAGRLKGFFRSIYFLPTISSTVAVALIWGQLYQPQWGLISTVMKSVGLAPPRAFLADPQAFVFGIPLAMVSVIVAYLWQDFGYNLVIFIAALQGIPQQIKDAARVDGASGWQQFRHVTLPLLRPTLLFVCVLTMLSALQQFVLVDVLTNGGPRDQTTTILMSVYANAFRYQNMGWAASMSTVLFLIILAFTVLQFRVLRTDWEY